MLFCQTSGNDPFDFACLEMTPAAATRLLAYRAVWERVAQHDARLYDLEFFNYEVEYGADVTLNGLSLVLNLEENLWFTAPPGTTLFQDGATTVETLKVTRDGVLWSAAPKHWDGESGGEGTFATPKIAWSDLEAVAAGREPFPVLPLDENTEEEEEEEEDDLASP